MNPLDSPASVVRRVEGEGLSGPPGPARALDPAGERLALVHSLVMITSPLWPAWGLLLIPDTAFAVFHSVPLQRA